MSRFFLILMLTALALVSNAFLSAQAIATVKVYPERTTLHPGQSLQFTAKGYDEGNAELPFVPEWSATGGEVTVKGVFTAGNREGVYTVIASYWRTGAGGEAVVFVRSDERVVARLELQPAEVRLACGGTCRFEILAFNSKNQLIDSIMGSVSWGAMGGKITTDGRFTAGPMPGAFRVMAKVQGVEGNAVVHVGKASPVVAPGEDPDEPEIDEPEIDEPEIDEPEIDEPEIDEPEIATGPTVKTGPTVTTVKTGPTVPTGPTVKTGPTVTIGPTVKTGPTVTIGPKIVVREAPKVVRIALLPERVALQTGESCTFRLEAYGADSRKIPMTLPMTWRVVGGSIQANGVFTAGGVPGEYKLTVQTPEPGIRTESHITIRRN